ncbi:MAG: BMP family protein [Capsulimonadales bacterium]|nr:BMP family protein [Capsulimonadales bacterium]
MIPSPFRRDGGYPLPRRRFLGVVCATLIAAGCAQQEPAPSPSAGSPTAAASPASPDASAGTTATGALKAGMIVPGQISDRAWSGPANDGLQRVKTELSAEVLPAVESPALAQVEKVLRDLAGQGCTIVYAHGSEYDDAAKTAADQFPNTTFVVTGGKSVGKNLKPIRFASGQATYLAGMLAGGMTKTGKIGLVGGPEIPIIKEAFQAFENGAKAVRPDVKVTTTFTGDGKDVAKAKQQAQALLDAGADVLMHNANDAGEGVFEAVSAKEGAMVIGANSDQSDKATPKNLGSFILDVPSAIVGVAREIKEGANPGEAYAAGLKDKAVGFKFNDRFAGTIPAELKDRMTKAEAAMSNGELNPNG